MFVARDRSLWHLISLMGIAILLVTIILVMVIGHQSKQVGVVLESVGVLQGGIEHPAHVIDVDDQRYATELFNNRIVQWANGQFPNIAPVLRDIPSSAYDLQSPHFLYLTADRELLISEGWGSQVQYLNIDDGQLTALTLPDGLTLNAPHGVCIDQAQQWIYIADSLHSRIVRINVKQPAQWQVYPDHKLQVAYGRQLLCRNDGIWLANSYEERPGLNPGKGSNVLRISHFDGGRAEVMAQFDDTNITGLAVVDERWLIVGLWGHYQTLAIIDLEDGAEMVTLPRRHDLSGPPYGLSYKAASRELLVAYIGDIRNRTNAGGIVVYRVRLRD